MKVIAERCRALSYIYVFITITQKNRHDITEILLKVALNTIKQQHKKKQSLNYLLKYMNKNDLTSRKSVRFSTK